MLGDLLKKVSLVTALCFVSVATWILPLWAADTSEARFTYVSLTAEQLQDDLDSSSLRQAIEQSRLYYKGRPGQQMLPVCDGQVTVADMDDAMAQLLLCLQERGGDGLAGYLLENFDFCQAGPMLVTGYYEPLLQGSLQPTPMFTSPIYGVPTGALRQASRRQIEEEGLLQGQEVVYLSNALDAFFVHVQGSALVKLPDGSVRRLHYAADNGRAYSSIGKILIEQGKMARDDVSLATIKAYLAEHPWEVTPLLQQNERYIFFSLSLPLPPLSLSGPPGAVGQSLVAGRSVALDAKQYASGGLGWLQSSLPAGGEPRGLTRLVANHDRGSAIKGARRLDLFVGQGDGAGKVAGEMNETGRFFFMVPKRKVVIRPLRK